MNEFLDWIKPPITAIISMISALTGTASSVVLQLNKANTGLQHAAWTIAIIAGLFSIANCIRNWVISDKSIWGGKRKKSRWTEKR